MVFQLIIAGLESGFLYALFGLGVVLLHRGTHLINFAFGEQVMVGAYFILGLQLYTHFPFFISLLIVSFISLMLGVLLWKGIFSHIRDYPMVSLVMVTLGISSALKGMMRFITKQDSYNFPPVLGTRPIEFGNILFDPRALLVISIGTSIMVLFFVFFRFAKFGRFSIATFQSLKGAFLVGIPVNNVLMLLWAITSLVAGVTGILVAPITLIYPDMGVRIFGGGLAGVMLGGIDSFAGAVVGGVLIGLIEKFSGMYISSSIANLSPFIVIIIVMILMPEGLFNKGITKRV